MKRSRAFAAALAVAGGIYALAMPGATGAQQSASASDPVPQAGRKADELRATLREIKLPPGFRIDLYAVAPGARQMALSDGVVFVGTRENRVWAVTNGRRAGTEKNVQAFAPSAGMHDPNGVCMSRDGTLYVAESNSVLAFPAAASAAEAPGISPRQVMDEIVPPSEVSYNHGARVCRIGPDNKLYIAVGQPYNVPPIAKQALYDKWDMGGIIRTDRDGSNREAYAKGIRNSVGMDFDPRTGDLWFTDNQVDGMGNNRPPEELDRVTKPGENFGFPWYGGGHVRTAEYKNQTPPADVVFPALELPAHAADLGIIFYRGTAFPEKYRNAVFIAQHGSWNRSPPIGARVSVVFFKKDGTPDRVEPFAQGWLDQATGDYSGRPVDVEELPDGSLLVSDDYAGAIYRISYGGE